MHLADRSGRAFYKQQRHASAYHRGHKNCQDFRHFALSRRPAVDGASLRLSTHVLEP